MGAQMENRDPEESKRFLDLIKRNIEDMEALIEGLLTHSRVGRQALEIQKIDMERLVREVYSGVMSVQISRDVRLTLHPLPPAHADLFSIRLVWRNLIENAIKFTRSMSVAELEVGAISEQGRQVYFVRDNGIGFPMKYADKVFEVFQRIHGLRQYEGTGVGLAIVQRIVTRHGGTIWVESVEDVGTTFFFTLGGGT
jgi:light-regulated signal transduction histidine kinase (bacteriophytochrome)